MIGFFSCRSWVGQCGPLHKLLSFSFGVGGEAGVGSGMFEDPESSGGVEGGPLEHRWLKGWPSLRIPFPGCGGTVSGQVWLASGEGSSHYTGCHTSRFTTFSTEWFPMSSCDTPSSPPPGLSRCDHGIRQGGIWRVWLGKWNPGLSSRGLPLCSSDQSSHDC